MRRFFKSIHTYYNPIAGTKMCVGRQLRNPNHIDLKQHTGTTWYLDILNTIILIIKKNKISILRVSWFPFRCSY